MADLTPGHVSVSRLARVPFPAFVGGAPVGGGVIGAGFADVFPPGDVDADGPSLVVGSPPYVVEHGLDDLLVIFGNYVVDPSVGLPVVGPGG